MTTHDLDVDRRLIEALGGATRVAGLLGFDKQRGGVQRVHNWISRGIPAHVKVKRPDLFLRDLTATDGAPSSTEVRDAA